MTAPGTQMTQQRFELPAELRLRTLDWLTPQEVIAKADWHLQNASWEKDVPDVIDLDSAEYEEFEFHHGALVCVRPEFGGDGGVLPKRLANWVIRRALGEQALGKALIQQPLKLGSKLLGQAVGR